MSQTASIFNVSEASWSWRGAIVRCSVPDIDITTIGAVFSNNALSAAILRCSSWRDTTSALWNVNSRAQSVSACSIVNAEMSRASRAASSSSAHTTAMGRIVAALTAAAMCARWISDNPDTTAGHAPASIPARSRLKSGS